MQSALGAKTGIGQCAEKTLAAMGSIKHSYDLFPINWGRDLRMRMDRRLRWQQIEVPLRARQFKADLLHVPGFDAPIVKPCPVILTVHDLIGMLFPNNLPPISRFYWSKWLPYTIRFADIVIADSLATQRDLVQLIKFPSEKIRVVPLGVDDQFAPPAQERIAECRKRYSLPDDFILYLGTLEPRKGIDTLIEALHLLKDHISHSLVIVGKKGWYYDRIQAQITRLGLKNRVYELGYIADEDLPCMYGAASTFVFPSRYEGFGLPIIEAMACGTPVITTNISSLPEVAGDSTLLVSPDHPGELRDAVYRVLNDLILANELRVRGISRAKLFTWQKTAQMTLSIYEEVARLRYKSFTTH
jgi:glycosyltransferase involved in cell wall biosynthesis